MGSTYRTVYKPCHVIINLQISTQIVDNAVKIVDILKIPSVEILLYVYDQGGEVRYLELTNRISSRGTLSKSLKDLMTEKLMDKRIERGKPMKAFYFLTSKGKEVAKRLHEISKYYS